MRQIGQRRKQALPRCEVVDERPLRNSVLCSLKSGLKGFLLILTVQVGMAINYKQNQTRKRPQFARRRSWRPCFRDSRSSCAQITRFSRKNKKSFSQIEAKEKKLIFLSGGHGPDRSQNRLILAISQWRTQEESPTSEVFPERKQKAKTHIAIWHHHTTDRSTDPH